MTSFPILLRLQGRTCVVVGAGRVAAAKAAGLLNHGAHVVVVAPKAVRWIREKAQSGKLAWRRRTFSARDVRGAFLVVAATNSAASNGAVFRACHARGVFCNVVDDPEHCDFFLSCRGAPSAAADCDLYRGKQSRLGGTAASGVRAAIRARVGTICRAYRKTSATVSECGYAFGQEARSIG